ncbi:MAG: hypothetical protein GC192_14765 [Bacteroidetes bacterium]|nr:hypothetical protein [Bacteroidota bacterium]
MEENKFFWPPKAPDYPAWMANFTAFVVANATVLGFTPTEVAWLQERSTAASYAEKVLTELKKLWLDYVNLRNIQWVGDPNNPALPLANWIPLLNPSEIPTAVPPNAKATLDGMVKRVSTCNEITREQKRSAGVLSRERTKENPNEATPYLKVTVVNGQAVLNCPLRSFKGYTIYAEDGVQPLFRSAIALPGNIRIPDHCPWAFRRNSGLISSNMWAMKICPSAICP